VATNEMHCLLVLDADLVLLPLFLLHAACAP
jgi:hypothetical protein